MVLECKLSGCLLGISSFVQPNIEYSFQGCAGLPFHELTAFYGSLTALSFHIRQGLEPVLTSPSVSLMKVLDEGHVCVCVCVTRSLTRSIITKLQGCNYD